MAGFGTAASWISIQRFMMKTSSGLGHKWKCEKGRGGWVKGRKVKIYMNTGSRRDGKGWSGPAVERASEGARVQINTQTGKR